jgi:ThiC-associated domain
MVNSTMAFSSISTPTSYPESNKCYLQGSRPDLRVPYREVFLSATHHHSYIEDNPPIPIYDASGPYTDPEIGIDLNRGLPVLRNPWIAKRDDTEILNRRTSEYARGREGDLLTSHLRFPGKHKPRRAQSGRNVSQMHYARLGVVTPEMEFVALRESMRLERLIKDTAGSSLSGSIKESPSGRGFLNMSRQSLCAPKWPPAARLSREHKPPRARADDHRTEFQSKNQR